MARYEASEEKPKKRSRAGIVLLMILLILAGTVGYLYYSVCKAPLALDDPQKLASSAPMAAQERFRFSAAEGTAQVKLDKADLWHMILANAGDDFLDTVNKEVSPYGLKVSGCAINMDEEGLELDLELFYQETRLVAKIPCDLSFSGQRISLMPTAVKLGVIPIPVGGLLSSLKLEYEQALPVITEVTGVSFAPGAVVLTGPVEQDVRTLLPLGEELDQAVVFCEAYQPLVDALHNEAGFAKIMTYLEQHPGKVEDFYRELFILADSEVTENYLDSRQGLTQRFFPGIDFSAAAIAQADLTEQLTALGSSLEQFFTDAVNDYNDKNFQLSNGEFLKKKKPFHATQYGGGKYDALFEVLDPDSFFLVLVDVEGGFIRKTSSFYRMADENQQFTQEVDFNKTYILGCVIRSVDGDPFLMYEEEIEKGSTYFRNIVLHPLTEDDVAELQVEGKFGVWTG